MIAAFSFAITKAKTSDAQDVVSEQEQETPNCQEENDDILNSETAIASPEGKALVWINGFYLGKGNMGSRATIAVLLKFPQGEEQYIDKVVLGDEDKNALGVRYFTKENKNSSGFPPYMIFHNIDLSFTKRLFLVYQVKKDGERTIYRKTLSDRELNRSKLDGLNLPAKIAYALDNDHNGIISNPMMYKTDISAYNVADHMVRAYISDLRPDGYFKIRVSFFHEDIDEDHYMRYFIVTDPVGRILGITQRQYNDGNKKEVIVSSLTESERQDWGLTKDQVAKITDCPYVMVFAEDVKEVISQSFVYFR